MSTLCTESPTLMVALVEPEIPQNTGNIGRSCVATGVPLAIVGRPSFRLDDRAVRRAGLDYWVHLQLHRMDTLQQMQAGFPHLEPVFLTTKATRPYSDYDFTRPTVLVFGPETRGLPADLLQQNPDRCLTIPMPSSNVRSLNLASSVSIVLFEALRQRGWKI